jgi:ankyrin repeat protein
MSSKNNGKKSNNIQYVLMDDNRTLASYGIVGSSDDIYTLQMVVVPPLTQEEIEALQRKVYNAAEAGDPPRMQTAIQAVKDVGADLNWRNPNNYGQTSVWIAARNGSDGCLSQLIAAGADVNIANTRGTTPVWIAT